MRISDWSSDVCSSDLPYEETRRRGAGYDLRADQAPQDPGPGEGRGSRRDRDGKRSDAGDPRAPRQGPLRACVGTASPGSPPGAGGDDRSEEHTSELQSLMRISYAVFCLTQKKNTK